ncbi:very-long-chain 3-oxoacyl-CoA reductase [Caerostris darwini]|uniref:Very-long-chain 3-oxoacyl-CoA reductase n=1 Tax=Caerostris darwini TaxID=1538125 RepID=A0AAV4R9D5_9ARAC|nr:very-long-chain 3-oxoacyl-CoA reductase [Caerostris darwini]
MSVTEKCSLSHVDSKDIIWYIGFILIFCLALKFIRSCWCGLYTCFIADLIGATVDWRKLGRWAVVTGSTDGIGKSYAKALAAKGFNVVLISRTQAKLDAVAEEIVKKYSVETKTIAVDITDDVTIYDKIKKEIENLDIGVLVNNVGMSYQYAEYLTKVKDVEKFADDLIKANIVSCTRMTIMVLPTMEKLRKGVILNVSSLSALSPFPLLSMYSASKVYVNYFTKAIHEEYRRKGIIIQSVLPGFVATNMSKMRPSFNTCTPDAFVKWALKTVGVENQTYGYPVHKLQGYFQELLATYVPESFNLSFNHKMMGDIRRRYYRKYRIVDDEIDFSKNK